MIALVRGWLLCVTGAAILAAIAEALMPEGGVKQVGRIVCGLVLILAVLQPIRNEDATNLAEQWEYDKQQLQLYTQRLREETDGQMKKIIEGEMSAYSMDKAAQLGVDCQIFVICQQQEQGVFLPVSARIEGVSRREDYSLLEDMLWEDLGISAQNLTFQEVSEP